MMSNFRNMIWLCWILSVLLSLADCEPNGNGTVSGSGPEGKNFPNGGHRPFGKHSASNPHKFGQGSRPQQPPSSDNSNSGQDSTSGLSGQAQQQQAPTPGEQTTPLSAALAPPATSAFLNNPVATASFVVPIPITSSPVFAQPYSIANAAGESYPSPPTVLVSDSTPSTLIIIPSSASPIFNAATIAQPFGTITRTVSLTVTVPAASGSAAPDLAPDPTTTLSTTVASAIDLAPLSTTSGTMSASAKAGMGIGITFGILSLASVAGLGFYLWRRKRNARHLTINEESGDEGSNGLGGFFVISKWKRPSKKEKEKADAGWSIESASQVEIVRGASTQTVSRGSSTTTYPPLRSSNTEFRSVSPLADRDLEAAPKGRSSPPLRLNNMALTSNPPWLPRLEEFPSPPSSAGANSLHIQAEKKTNSWPLED